MTTLKTLAAAAALLASGLASAATVYSEDYTVTYDETTSFGWISSLFIYGSSPGGPSSVGIEWSLSPSINVTSSGGAAVSATFAIPDFTIKATPGHVLTGDVTASLGNIVYFLSGAGATTSITSTGSVSINGGSAVTLPSTALTQTPATATFGTFADSATFSGGTTFNSFTVSGASITLSASGGSFAGIGAQSQNKLHFDFTTQAVAVPEPETYALMLAGIGIVGFMARRRQQR